MKGNRQSCIGRRLTTAVLLAAGNVTALFAQPLVSTHPVNLSVFVGQTASFTARANGISPLMEDSIIVFIEWCSNPRPLKARNDSSPGVMLCIITGDGVFCDERDA